MIDLDAQVSCSGCGYDLMGGGREGRCPECGQAFDIALGKGVTAQSAKMRAAERGERLTYLVKLWALLLLGAGCVGLGALRALMVGDWQGPMLIGLLFGGLFAFAALATWFTEQK